MNNNQVPLKAISVSVEQVNALDALLNDYLAKIPARSILLIDTAGQVVTSCGNLQNADLVTFGSLSAGYLAASQEIARISGEYQEFQMVIREGSRINNFLTDAGAHLALTFNIEVSVPLGWARLNILQAARAVNEIMAKPEQVTPMQVEGQNKINYEEQINTELDQIWN